MDQHSFQPALGLSNPNLQTIVSSVGRKIIKPAWLQDFTRRSQRRDIRVQGQHLTAQYDYAHNEDAVLVMIIHGWLGSADSSYVLSTAHTLQTAGFHVARLTLRDHKPQYLADAPRFVTYVHNTCARYREFKPLLRFIDGLEGLDAATGFAYGRA